ncbi:MAG TPA: glycosyltransferase family 4 protein [Candidatus Saccharibacteria bacterium]|nr:glycosyltransferase family 4 protein [Candidatus Saccharibacteria bacterium]HRQ07116.1 glycosyltransferase family 4 protein [Candidatus Saccharibacteria bacterium]
MVTINNKDKPKKALIVGQHYWPETFRITDIAEGLVENGYDVTVLCGTPNYPTGKFFKGYRFLQFKKETHNGVKIIRVPEIPRGNNSNVRIFINYISFPLFSLFYIPFLLFRRYDRVIAYQLSPVFMSLPAIILAKLKRKPLYFYVCDFWPHSLLSILDIKNSLVRKFITSVSYWHYRRSDGIIGVFKGMQERFISEVGILRDKTLYIPQAPEKIYELQVNDKDLQKRFSNTFNVLFAGNINPAQCFDVITKAAKIVKDKGHTNIRYVILGDGMSRKWLENEVKRLNIDDQFVFEGFKPVEDVPKYQTIADATIVALSKSPLFEYGIPAKVYSYMASGKPILGAMDGEGKRLINEYSSCGFCVDSGDSKGLAKSIAKLVNMPKTDRKKMGRNGQKYHFEHFEREINLNRFIEFVFNNNRIIDNEYPDY